MPVVETPIQGPPTEQDTLEAAQRWNDAVLTVTSKAYDVMPDQKDAIRDAYKLVVEGRIEPTPDGLFKVTDGDDPDVFTCHVGQGCDCPEALQSPKVLCIHKIAVGIYRRAKALIAKLDPTAEQSPTPPATPPATPPPTQRRSKREIPEQYIATIKGKPAIRFVGLLMMAHEEGLCFLDADWTYNDAELSLAHATAKFRDGRVFCDSGDSTPTNVTAFVKEHFRRVALTRAKARALKDALNIDMVSDEELAD
jgi:hypothetical protein